MRKVGILTATLAAVILAGGVDIAATETERRVKTSKSTTKAKNRRVCKRVKVTGTHFAQRICQTQAQWDAMGERDREQMERINPAAAPDIPIEGGAPPI